LLLLFFHLDLFSVSADLMLSYPASWKSANYSLDSEIDLIGRFSHHLSLYELEVYRSTQLGKSVRDRMVKMPLEKEQIRGYELALIALQSQGFSRYEVSNFAREEAAQSQQNLHLWQGNHYLGFG
jgi:oxygen-independent coproporphyrinogen-3 oxidase